MVSLSGSQLVQMIFASAPPRALPIFSCALSTGFMVLATNANATTNELEIDYFSFVVNEIIEQGFPCSAGDIGHILYEDDLVAVLEVSCESGESYEIIDLYNMEDVIVEPIENISEKDLDYYFDRISYSVS